MATKRLPRATVRNDEYYKGIALEAINYMLMAYPPASHESIAKAMMHCFTDKVLHTIMLDKRLTDSIQLAISEELDRREITL